LVLFNLIPAIPMDGGRVLRALLAHNMGHTRGTQIAATVGRACAVVMGLIGLFVSPVLLFIALFVWMGASQEAAAAQIRSALSNTPVSSVMLTDFALLESTDTLAEAVRLTLNGSQRDFPVIDAGRAIGIVSGTDLLSALATHEINQPVTVAMRPDVPVAEASEMLDSVFGRLLEKGVAAIPVVSNGVIVGLLTMEKVHEYLLVRATLQEYNARTGGIARDTQVKVGGH
jgi:CBS domain-containing protein